MSPNSNKTAHPAPTPNTQQPHQPFRIISDNEEGKRGSYCHDNIIILYKAFKKIQFYFIPFFSFQRWYTHDTTS